MKRLGISHDNAHCNGTWGCKMRDNCVRYLLHKELLELKDPGLGTYHAYLLPNRRGGVCEYYWEYKEEKK